MNSREKALFRHQESFGNASTQHLGIFDELNAIVTAKETDLSGKELEARIALSLELSPTQIRRSSAHLFKRMLRVLKNNVKDRNNQIGAFFAEIESLRARGVFEPAIPLCDQGLEMALEAEEFERAVNFIQHKIEILRTLAMGEEWPEIEDLILQRIQIQKNIIEIAQAEERYFGIKQLVRQWQRTNYHTAIDFSEFIDKEPKEVNTVRGKIFSLMGKQNIAYQKGSISESLRFSSEIIHLFDAHPGIKEVRVPELLNQYQLAILFAGLLKDETRVNYWLERLAQESFAHSFHALLQRFYLTLPPFPFYMDNGDVKKAEKLFQTFNEIKFDLGKLPLKNSVRLYYRAVLHLNYSGQIEQALRLSFELKNLLTHKFSAAFRFGVDLQHLCLLVDNGDFEEVVRERELIYKRMRRNEEISPFSNEVLAFFRELVKSSPIIQSDFWKKWDQRFSENYPEYNSEDSIYILSRWIQSKMKRRSIYSLLQPGR